ncbi:hypothetical protein GCM10011375_29560 [Hymenobacter qilianensis]|uniref:Uncharacterized protein n=2 Tax=Hymenobacter qilianensis TaxID=1385715 RepID=A0ACB5PU88_9BACT|nr:hypothetical protein [Hymenobacter qilianensis]QNP51719.1 hypothetical protein H9L05_17395 [Hymenobacter qilianensis]GGF72510.1 hypothetical protein GCM10011375_29560 [Hymenobacter qilianensis]
MPKTIDYPRTSYLSAWEVAEVVDDTGGKCAIETCARKLNRKVSGSFKAIIGSAVKFGLITSKRELLTTTNLFRRIKHAYDKQEEKVFHREAFLHPPLFTQICRKFRSRELPVHMLDVMLIREFGVEEINAQNVAKAFVEGARMVGVMDERNVVADIDQLAAQQPPRRELASTDMPMNLFRAPATATAGASVTSDTSATKRASETPRPQTTDSISSIGNLVPKVSSKDAVSALFGLDTDDLEEETEQMPPRSPELAPSAFMTEPTVSGAAPMNTPPSANMNGAVPKVSNSAVPTQTQRVVSNSGSAPSYSIRITGPGMDTQFNIQDLDDVEIVRILLEKIRRQLAG